MLSAATFIDKAKEQSFNELGYASLPSVLTPDEVAALLHLYKEHHTHITAGQSQWNSLYEKGLERGLEISQEIKNIIEPILSNYFINWKLPVATFMSKNPIKDSTCDVHRDFTTLNEASFQYRNIWIPLVDISSENGALFVVPQSHILFDEIRPMFSEWPYHHLTKELQKYLKIFYPKAGDMIVYADKTLHGSHTNRTTESRPVIHGGILHTDATLHYYQLNADSKELKIYEVPLDFYFKNEFDDSQLSQKYTLKKRYTFVPKQLEPEDIHRFYQGEQ